MIFPLKGSLRIYSLLYLLCLSASTQGQSFGAERYTSKDNLLNTHVTEILSDGEGYLWMATKYGLSRFNGYEFVNHSHDPQDSFSLGLEVVSDLFLDREKTLWVAGDGLCRYDSKRKGFSKVPHAGKWRFISIVGEDSQGMLWLASSGGFVRFDKAAGQMDLIPIADHRLQSGSAFAIDSEDGLWVGDASGVHRFAIASKEKRLKLMAHWPAEDFEYGEAEFEVMDFHWEAANDLWVATSFGIHRLQADAPPQLLRSIPELDPGKSGTFFINDMETDSLNNLWVTQGRNLLMVSPERTEVSMQHEFRVGGLQYFWLDKLFLDASNICWVASQGGAFKITQQFFDVLGPSRGRGQSLFKRNVYALYEEKPGTLWIGAKGGAVKVLRQGEKWDVVRGSAQFDISDLSLVESGQSERLYFGTYGRGMLYEQVDGGLRPIWEGMPDSLEGALKGLKCVYEAADGTLWLGSKQGLWYRDPESGVFASPQSSFPVKGRVVSMVPNGDSTCLWVGLGANLVRVDLAKRAMSGCFPPGMRCVQTRSCEIQSLLQDKEGMIWVGRRGNGLSRFDPASRQWTLTLRERDNLAGEQVRALLLDNAGALWVSTDRGISQVNLETGEPRSYFPKDGLPMEDFNIGAACKLQSGELLFGGRNGVLRFDPEKVARHQGRAPLRLAIDQVRINSEPASRLASSHLGGTETLTIAPEEEFFEIRYTTLNYHNQTNFSYQYRLEGFDETWKTTRGDDRVAKYINVPPGDYRFEVKLVDEKGMDLGVSKAVDVVVRPKFLEQAWVRVSGALMGLGLGGGVLLLYLRQVSIRKKEEQMRRERSEAIMQALRSQMNPHFIYNSLNSINSYISNNNVEMANRYLVDFAALMRLILSHSKNEFITLEEELQTLHLYLGLEQLRLGKQLTYEVRIAEEIHPQENSIPPLLIQPFVENAIWHGIQHKEGMGKLEISFSKRADMLVCRVQDDGVGRQRSGQLYARFGNKPDGWSTDNIFKRIQAINQMKKMTVSAWVRDLQDGMGVPTGTLVELSFSIA